MSVTTPCMLNLDWGMLTGATVVKKDAWDRIPPDVQPLEPLAAQQHLLVYTLDVYRWPKVELNFGLGQPLTRASGGWVLNSNLGLELP